MRRVSLFLFFSTLFISSILTAQSGKIAGTVTDQTTGDPLIGVNIIIEGSAVGAATDIEGYYVILNVQPGKHNLKVSYIGYTPEEITDVEVNIDQTTIVDLQLSDQSIETAEVIVTAAKIPIVQQDVSSSRANISSAEIENLPTLNVNRVLGTQAGVRASDDGVVVRGGGIRETAYVVNGITMRDERDNTPYTGISVTAIENVQITTGGFSAEYGDLRSGLVNIVTREGSRQKYSLNFIGRYQPAQQKHFGISPHSTEAYWVKPYIDDAVAWTGTKNGAWDEFTQLQFPEFEGWNSLSQKTLANDDPSDDLTPEAAQRVFLWEKRRQLDIQDPDYDMDMSLSGPIPGGKALGDLRFLASYRATTERLLIPLVDDAYRDWSASVKLTSDLGVGMKLMVDGLWGKTTGVNSSRAGGPGIFRSAGGIADQMSQVSFIDTRLFATDYWNPSEVKRNSIGAKFTHVVNPTTFYEVILSRFGSEYDSNPGRLRDTTKIKMFGNGYWVDEAPFGFQPAPSNGISGMRMGVGMSNSRDSSKIASYTAKFDLTSQLDKYNQLKAGLSIIYTNNQTNYGSVDKFLPQGRSFSVWDTQPVRGALYIEDKLEFEGMIANLGVRLDYFDSGQDWWIYDPWTDVFKGENSLQIDELLEKQPAEKHLEISPRLGVAFPISINSKLFFNYGHQRSFPTPENIYLLRRDSFDNRVLWIGNPNNPLEKTIQYELGYEHNLFDQFLLRIAGYYKDVQKQPFLVEYINRDGDLNYDESTSNSYRDIRGFEITLSKNRGLWFQGFVNYTYEVISSGFFGFARQFENPALQRDYERTTDDSEQSKPVPQPYASANISFLTPSYLGDIWGDWRLSILADWRSGFYFTWTGGGSIPGIFNNVQWKDASNVDLRFSKNFRIGDFLNLELIMDISNLFDTKHMSNGTYGFFDGNDYNAYMKSLHLPRSVSDELSTSYINIPGDDDPGDYRIAGDFQPIVTVQDLNSLNENTISDAAIYWERSSERYFEFTAGAWERVEDAKLNTIIKNKQYIDMPNMSYFSFLNPRQVYFGLKFTVELF